MTLAGDVQGSSRKLLLADAQAKAVAYFGTPCVIVRDPVIVELAP